jgi:type II secretory pathway pseudopilin PulG
MKSKTKSGLFLLELLVALLVFAFCAAICLRIFVAASTRAKDAENLNQAVRLATTAAENYKSGTYAFPGGVEPFGGGAWETEDKGGGNYVLTANDKGYAKYVIVIEPDKVVVQTSVSYFYDEAGLYAPELESKYAVTVTADGEIAVTLTSESGSGEPIYSLTAAFIFDYTKTTPQNWDLGYDED